MCLYWMRGVFWLGTPAPIWGWDPIAKHISNLDFGAILEMIMRDLLTTIDSMDLLSPLGMPINKIGFKLLDSGFETCPPPPPPSPPIAYGAGGRTHCKSRFCAILKKKQEKYYCHCDSVVFTGHSAATAYPALP